MLRKERMLKRLEIIRNAVSQDDNDILCYLRSEELISSCYDFRNLATDRWYLARSEEGFPRIGFGLEECNDSHDPIKSIWFRCIFLAIYDARSRRPCDLNAWYKDQPPMSIETCTEDLHICSPSAVGFLLSLTDDHERLGGLSPGTIKRIIAPQKFCFQNH